jgi:hypothetical protein
MHSKPGSFPLFSLSLKVFLPKTDDNLLEKHVNNALSRTKRKHVDTNSPVCSYSKQASDKWLLDKTGFSQFAEGTKTQLI